MMSERLAQEEVTNSEALRNIPKDDRGRRAKVSDTAERVAGAGTSFRCGVFVRCEKCGITVHPIGYRRHVKNLHRGLEKNLAAAMSQMRYLVW